MLERTVLPGMRREAERRLLDGWAGLPDAAIEGLRSYLRRVATEGEPDVATWLDLLLSPAERAALLRGAE